jgi:hypothetical protein
MTRTHKEQLEIIIRYKGRCVIAIVKSPPGLECHGCPHYELSKSQCRHNNNAKLLEAVEQDRYKASVEMYIKKYGKEAIVEILL